MKGLSVGEPAPWFSVPNSRTDGRIVLDELAGTDVVLVLADTASGDRTGPVLEMLERAAVQGTALIALYRGEGATTGGEAAPAAWRVGRDPNGDIARLFGIEAPSPDGVHAILLSRSLQVLARASGSAEVNSAIVPLIEARRSEPPAPLDAPVLIVPNVFDADFCDALVRAYEAEGGREIGVIEAAGKATERFDPTFRKRLDWYVSDERMVQTCRDGLVQRLLPMIHRAFQFRTTRIERYLVGCYEAAAGGVFRAHRDNTAPPVAHRRFAVTINLNDAFEGGRLSFPEFGPKTYRPAKGSAVVFSCSLLHEVTPMVSGTRYAFLTFLYDEEAQKMREQYARNLGAQPPQGSA